MRIYLVTHKKQNFSFVFEYSLKGNITAFKSSFNMTHAMVEEFRALMPFKASEIENFTNEKWTVKLLEDGLSFEFFWKKYNHKQGDKQRAKRLYNDLDDVEKAKAINYIPRYDNALKLTPGINKAHATTYLNQKRFNNE